MSFVIAKWLQLIAVNASMLQLVIKNVIRIFCNMLLSVYIRYNTPNSLSIMYLASPNVFFGTVTLKKTHKIHFS